MTALQTQPSPAKERGIMFTGPNVRAILGKQKTQTRRIIKPIWSRCLDLDDPADRASARAGCRYGVPGDRLWVRETWALVFDCPALPCACEEADAREAQHGRLVYRATEPGGIADYACGFDCAHKEPGCARWRPSIHMPRWASRLALEVTEVRVERLQSITEEDAMAEGCDEEWSSVVLRVISAREGFNELWTSIHGKESWGENPWVWAVTFRML